MADYEYGKSPFTRYEYKKIIVDKEQAAMYVDCYKNFGWFTDGAQTGERGHAQIAIQMKRDRKLVNRMELTRLQRHFEACVKIGISLVVTVVLYSFAITSHIRV